MWASGAATAAFDAFDDHVPAAAVDDVHSVAAELVNEPDAGVQSGLDALADAGVPDVAGVDDPSLQFDGPVIDEAPVDDAPAVDDWSHSAPEDHHAGSRRFRLRHLRLVTTTANTKMRGPYGRAFCAFEVQKYDRWPGMKSDLPQLPPNPLMGAPLLSRDVFQ